MWLRFAFYTYDKLKNPKRLNETGPSWNSAEKTFRPDFRLIEPKLQSIEIG